MSTAVACKSGLCSVPGRVCAPPHVWSCLSGRGRLCQHKSPTVLSQGFTGRHASSWPGKASRLQVKCKCMVSDPQDRRAAESRTLVLLNSINDSAKWAVTLTAGGVLVWHHNIDVSWSLLGSIVTVFLCKVLKKVINAQRPRYAKKTDPGMPSSHASSMAYLSVYMAVAWHPEQYLLADLGLVLAAFLIPLRVVLGYHSVPQVLAGATLGAASAASWYRLGQLAVLAVLKSSTNSQNVLTLVVVAAVTGYLVLAFRK